MIHTTSSIREWGCKRKWKYKFIDRIRSRIKGKALLVGDVIHKGLESFKAQKPLDSALLCMVQRTLEEGFDFWGTNDGAIEMRRASAIIRAYYTVWSDTLKNYQSLEIEKEFSIKLGGVNYSGKIDWVTQTNNDDIQLWDHKTTSDEIDNVGEDYWQLLQIDRQITAYAEALRQFYQKEPFVIWDVIKKPLGKPKTKERIVKRKSETDQEFEQRKAESMESLQEFEDRLYQEMIDNKDQYLVRRQVHLTKEQSDIALSEIVETCKEIESYKGLYPKNDSLCRGKYGSCVFLNICTGIETIDSERFEKCELHPELSNTKDLLSGCPI